MNRSDHPQRHPHWLLSAWLLLILTGALTTSLLRAPLVVSGAMPFLLVVHTIGGGAITIIAIGYLVLERMPHRWWRVALVAGAGLFGWFVHRSFAPPVTATHAAVAAFAVIALADVNFDAPTGNPSRPPTWISRLARIGFVLVFVQVAVGAALRHHLATLTWHLVIAGLAAMAVLASAVLTIQHQSAPIADKQAARSAIAAIVVQASLGVAVLFMMLIGPPNAGTWIGITVAHVVFGSVTLFAVGRFSHLLDRHRHIERLGDVPLA
jgi:hypothetical protein